MGGGNLGALFTLLESSQWVGFNEGDLELFTHLMKVQETLNYE
jgi:hypothetical protein